jgi:hypothetical protein
MKNRILILVAVVLISFQGNSQSNTQAYLGIKEGGEWLWVTKSNGTQQYEYQGGAFKSVNNVKVDKNIPTTLLIFSLKVLAGNRIKLGIGFTLTGATPLIFLERKQKLWFCKMLDWMVLIRTTKCRIGELMF